MAQSGSSLCLIVSVDPHVTASEACDLNPTRRAARGPVAVAATAWLSDSNLRGAGYGSPSYCSEYRAREEWVR